MISAIILTKNEEQNIIDCIETILFCDEIVVVDDNSEDRTVDLIKQLKNPKITVVTHPLENNFATQRNFALTQVKNPWVLFVDADERVSHALQYEILNHIHSSLALHVGYFIKRIDTMWGKKLLYGEAGNAKFLRLGKKDAGKWKGAVHERWVVNGKTESLKHPLMHYPHQTLTEFLTEINIYTTIRAQELYKKGKKSYWWSIILYTKAKFFMNYFLKLGFRDGIQGFLMAMLMSFHSFLVRGKLWLLWQKK